MELPDHNPIHIRDFEPIPVDILALIPEGMIRKNLIIPLTKRNGRLLVAVPETKNVIKPEGLEMVTGCAVDLVTVSLEEVTNFIQSNYPSVEAKPKPSLSVINPEVSIQADANIPRELLNVLKEAVKERASEVLVELKSNKPSFRFRVRGVLIEPKAFSGWEEEQAKTLFSAIRKLGEAQKPIGLDATQWRGSFQANDEDYFSELHLTETKHMSVLTIHLGAGKETLFDPKTWGMDVSQGQCLERLLNKKQGLVLFCGPEREDVEKVFYGSLKKMVIPQKHTMTVEDRAHQWMTGVDQFISEGDESFFNLILQQAVEHRPDVLGVNPLESKESFELCLKAALKGSFIQGRTYGADASDLLYRMISLGVEAGLIGSALQGIVVQQSIRLSCQKCQKKDPSGRSMSVDLGIPLPIRPPSFYKGMGCKACAQTGFDKEANIFEVIEMSDDIQKILLEKANPSKIRNLLKSKNFRTLRQVAIQKAVNGQTSLAEVVRVTPK